MSKRKNKYDEKNELSKKNAQNEEDEEENKGEENKNNGDENELREEENYEFLIPISNDNKLKSFVDRYFLKYYWIFSKEMKLSQYAFLHTNKLIMVGITNHHKIASESENIKEISFDCLHKGNINELVKGKKKRGGIKVKPDTHICEVIYENGDKIPIRAVIEGYIIELNENIRKNPSLLKNYPESKGYIALINVGIKGIPKKMEKLLSEDNYLKEMG